MLIRELKEFALRGNVVDMAIGIMIGGAFSPIAKSLVDDVLMPPLGLMLGDVDFADHFVLLRQGTPPPPYASLEAAKAAGAVTINYGVLVNTCLTFVLVAFAAFLIVKAMNDLRRREQGAAKSEPTTRPCPYCKTAIPLEASRCPQCTSQIGEATPESSGVAS